MRRKIWFPRKGAVNFFSLIILFQSYAIAQSSTLPFMYVKHSEFAARRHYFENNIIKTSALSKGASLDSIIQENYADEIHPRYYIFDTTFFNQLITRLKEDNNGGNPTYLKIYFAAFSPASAPFGFKNWAMQNQVVLIFSASPKGNFYIYGPNKSLYTLKEEYAKAWIKNYNDTVIRHTTRSGTQVGLNKTIYEEDASNYLNHVINDNTRSTFSDTKSTSCEWGYFSEFIKDEKSYQNSLHGSPQYTDAIEIDLVSYPLAGIGDNNPRGIPSNYYRNRLHLLFGFMHENNIYPILKNGRSYHNKWNGGDDKKGDNSQLCPPYNCN